MTSLKVLHAMHDSGIKQFGIRGLDLIGLNIYENGKVDDVSFMKNLKNIIVKFNSANQISMSNKCKFDDNVTRVSTITHNRMLDDETKWMFLNKIDIYISNW